MKKRSRFAQDIHRGPLLQAMRVSHDANMHHTNFPFTLPIIKNLKEIGFTSKVTFFVGENGAGKSTIIEAIAHKVGFGPEGGSKNISFKTSEAAHYNSAQTLADCLTLSWRAKPHNGYFFRAESFYNVANFLDTLADKDKTYAPYGGKSLHEQSHGESFLSFFQNRLGSGGFFIFDEPEAALSPARQLTLLAILEQMCANTDSQFIIATHSPILLAYPDATIYSCDSGILEKIDYKDTGHYRITKQFLDNPERYFNHLFKD